MPSFNTLFQAFPSRRDFVTNAPNFSVGLPSLSYSIRLSISFELCIFLFFSCYHWLWKFRSVLCGIASGEYFGSQSCRCARGLQLLCCMAHVLLSPGCSWLGRPHYSRVFCGRPKALRRAPPWGVWCPHCLLETVLWPWTRTGWLRPPLVIKFSGYWQISLKFKKICYYAFISRRFMTEDTWESQRLWFWGVVLHLHKRTKVN